MAEPKTYERDIIIAGGSLAGLSAAIKLKMMGYKPCVFEKSRFPREKLCGEFLGPDAIQALETLGLLGIVSKAAYGPVTDAYFYERTGKPLQIGMGMVNKAYPYALAIPRNRLDLIVQTQAKAMGIEVMEETCVSSSLKATDGYFDTRVSQVSEEMRYRSAFVIDATGRYGGLSRERSLKPKQPLEKTIGLQCHVNISLPDTALHMFLFPGGYGGLQPISPDTANLCLLFSQSVYKIDPQKRFDTMLDIISQNPKAAKMLKDADISSSVNSTGGLNQVLRNTGFIQIGDAKLTVEPFSGAGMAHAFETGLLAAESIGSARQSHAGYREALKRYENNYKSRYFYRLQVLRYFRPFLFSPTVQRWGWPFMKLAAPVFAPIIR